MNVTQFVLCFCLLSTTLLGANVRVAHLSPNAPDVDVLVGVDEATKSAVLENVGFSTVSEYLPVGDGSYFIDVVPSGATDPVINVDNLPLAGDLTIAAVNFVDSIEPLVLTDDRVTTAGRAKLRAVHAAPNAPAVDIFVDGAGLLPALTDLSFKDATDYLELAPGDYTFRIRANGSTDDLFVVEDLPLSSDTNYSAFAVGDFGSTFSVIPTVDAVPEPSCGFLLFAGLIAATCARQRRQTQSLVG